MITKQEALGFIQQLISDAVEDEQMCVECGDLQGGALHMSRKMDFLEIKDKVNDIDVGDVTGITLDKVLTELDRAERRWWDAYNMHVESGDPLDELDIDMAVINTITNIRANIQHKFKED